MSDSTSRMPTSSENAPPPGAADRHCIALVSGGLDSLLAAHLMLDQGIRVTALRFVTPFGCGAGPMADPVDSSLAGRPGFALRLARLDQAFLDMVRNPAHGYGKRMNPCIDCKILMLRHARAQLGPWGAQFVVTGEVLNQRPMSQKIFALQRIARESGLEGLLLRPLSAQLLPPTIPEQRGWVDRSRLGAIRGRMRKTQIEMARHYAVDKIPQPAGGCLLTDPEYASRLRDVLDHSTELTVDDMTLLRVGRHFRLSPSCKAIVGRNEQDNNMLQALAKPGDILLMVDDHIGPLTLLRGPAGPADIATAGGMTAAHSKQPRPDPAPIRWWTVPRPGADPTPEILAVPLPARETFEIMRVAMTAR
jgi:tRNA-specific 2-thiouridylase